MPQLPTAAEVRQRLQGLDDLDRKVVGGMVALCMTEPGRVRDREWVAERFVQVATIAHGFDAEQGPATTADVERVRDYATARFDQVMQATMALFVRTAEDLQRRGGTPTFADAQAIVGSYLA